MTGQTKVWLVAYGGTVEEATLAAVVEKDPKREFYATEAEAWSAVAMVHSGEAERLSKMADGLRERAAEARARAGDSPAQARLVKVM